jgi:hypothetical protein
MFGDEKSPRASLALSRKAPAADAARAPSFSLPRRSVQNVQSRRNGVPGPGGVGQAGKSGGLRTLPVA